MPPDTAYVVAFAIGLALIFDVVNGFHDAANSIATVVSTRVLSPRIAVLWAAGCNFLAMFLFTPRVADTISRLVQVRPEEPAFVYVVLAALIGALIWDILTWLWGLPTSSSHALVGALAGAGLAFGGPQALGWNKLLRTVAYIPLAPLMGFAGGCSLMLAVAWLLRHWRPSSVDALFRRLQVFSAASYALGHGGNDAQKTVGIILALLVAAGKLPRELPPHYVPYNILLACNAAMALGTSFGGWRLVKTMGTKIVRLRPVGGFCAEVSGALVLFFSTHHGIPVSTTHTITGAIIGVGSTRRLRSVRWGLAGQIVWAWLLTMPAAGAMAALCYWAMRWLWPQVL